MQYLGRLVGSAALALGTTALFGCYAPPPPVAAVTPEQVTPAYPPPAYPPVAAEAPTALTPPASDYNLPQYGSTGSVALAPSSAGTTSPAAPYAPPPLRVETPPPAPWPLAMWQPGHWSWNGAQYIWAPGHYVERPSPTATWLPGYWQQGPSGWTWIDGRWTS
jgi:WXXGXW repeat (2 copies)